MLNVTSFTFNPFQENTYLLWTDTGNCLIIDPGCYGKEEEMTLATFIQENKLNPVRLINTHCHIDHVLGNPFVHQRWGLTPEIHPLEQSLLDAVPQYGMMWGIRSDQQPETKHTLLDGSAVDLDGHTLQVLFTPGHSPGEICLFCAEEKILIAGDVLFHESIGRTDLPGGNYPQLEQSIRQRLYTLPDETKVYPGHGTSTTIDHEKRFNPFVKP